MKLLQLIGIGNALVDIEYRVTDEELAAFGVTKGAMTLTDSARQQDIIAALGDRDAHRSSGGSVANSIIAFAQFGGTAAFSSLLGHDAFGEFYAQEFLQLGITLNAEQIAGDATGTCVVMITPDSERTLNTTLAVNANYGPPHLQEGLIKGAEWLYIEGYKLTDDTGAEAIDHAAYYARKHGTSIAVSCSDRFIIEVFGDRLRSILKHTDLVFCNEVEAQTLAEEESLEAAHAALCSEFRNVVLTMGDKGSHIAWNGRRVTVPAYKVTPVDATGAGDMFAGAFLYGVLNRHHPEHAGRLASYAAGQVVAQYGARLKASHIDIRDTVLAHAPTVDSAVDSRS